MSYSGDPSASTLDEVRFLIGDTSNDPSTEQLTDDEITYVINKLSTTYSDALMYAAYCAEVLAANYAREVSISADGVSISSEQLQDKYRLMALALREEYATLHGVGAGPFAGGSLLGDHIWGERAKSFGLGMEDNPRAGRQDRSGEREDWSENQWP